MFTTTHHSGCKAYTRGLDHDLTDVAQPQVPIASGTMPHGIRGTCCPRTSDVLYHEAE
ncbi:protein of unknown function [Nitrospira japonica]|uniref:Uncharacterized protein n=1 Tax=Nitrospira japonica TaxID=1325564 RepID=A0A1W1I5M0_9BACT|nr:protein of unknown function [Nitrospira japonica]